MSQMCRLEEVYSRLCCTFRWCGRTVVEGGKARRSDRERGSFLSERASRRRASPTPAFTCTHGKRGGLKEDRSAVFSGLTQRGRPRERREVEGISRDIAVVNTLYLAEYTCKHAQLRETASTNAKLIIRHDVKTRD